MSVSLKDFQPINHWVPDIHGKKWRCEDGTVEPQYLIDQTTNRKYFNESKGVVRFKCFLLTFGTPFVHSFAALVNVALRIAKLVSFSHFWPDTEGETNYNFKERLRDAGRDLLRVVATPFSFLGLELASVYGLVRPYDGRKLYASIERATYGNFILAPCFQPDPERHAFGGDVDKKNAF